MINDMRSQIKRVTFVVVRAFFKNIPSRFREKLPPSTHAFFLGSRYILKNYHSLQRQMHDVMSLDKRPFATRWLDDPLFCCAMRPSNIVGASDVEHVGWHSAKFSFVGIKVFVRVTDPAAVKAGKIELRLNGRVLRELTLQRLHDNLSVIQYTIRRPVLELFPESCHLTVHAADGSALGLYLDEFILEAECEKIAYTALKLSIPFGNGEIFDHLVRSGPLDKKGRPRLSEATLQQRQDEMLDLYTVVRNAFRENLGINLFLLYGTLLGQYRGGDFIPGDDDFDVGFVSAQSDPAQVKAEAKNIMMALIEMGFIVTLNRRGRPFRVRLEKNDAEIHLDVHILFSVGDDHTWLHPRARLPIQIGSFHKVETIKMRNTDVLRPTCSELFLESHYGPDWKIPDPSYSHITDASDLIVSQTLLMICFTRVEQKRFARQLQKLGWRDRFISISLEECYPVDRYESRVGI